MTREQELIGIGRHRARTDLVWLSQNILGMKKIVPHVHGPMTDFLQKFDKVQGIDKLDESSNRYHYFPINSDPIKAFEEAGIVLDNEDIRRLLLAPRGWYKTSLNVVAHSIQWILNFPDITILALHASQEVLEPILNLIKSKFKNNAVMRFYFPEFCPPAQTKEFGTQQYFNIPSRKAWTASPTFAIGGIESTRTGMHYHVIKFSDIVDDKNSSTKDQCEKIVYSFGMARNLLVSPLYWMDIEGTRYNFSDLYGRILDEWGKETQSERPHAYKCFVMGCYKKDLKGEVETFRPDELDYPYLLDERQKVEAKTGYDLRRISHFPEEFPTKKLEEMRLDAVTGEEVFNTQQLNNPVGTDAVAFPLALFKTKTIEELKHVNFQHFITTVDLAESGSKRADFTVITTCGIDRTNRRYVMDIRMGKWLPNETVDNIFLAVRKWKPVRVKIEKSGFLAGLRPTILRKSELTSIWPNFDFIQRDTQQSKIQRILSLEPWYKGGLIYFSDGLDDFVKEHLKHELSRFPKYRYDDVLDTLADQFQNESVFGDIKPAQSMEQLLDYARKKMYENLDKYELIFGEQENISESYKGLGAL